MIGFNERHLYKVARSRGYETEDSVALEIQRLFAFRDFYTAFTRLRGIGFSFDESFVIASFFEMTPKEYCYVFLDGLFQQINGHFVCYVDDPDRFIREKRERNKQKKLAKEAEKREREELARQVDEL